MSIRLRSDGHSFPLSLPAGWERAEAVECVVLTHKTVLVPAELFDPAVAEHYLAVAGLGCGNGELAVFSDPHQSRVAVMAVGWKHHEELLDRLGSRLHYTTPLLAGEELTEPAVRLRHHEGWLFVRIYDRNGLRQAEALRAQGSADVLYYLGRINELFPLRNMTLRYSGSQKLLGYLRSLFREIQCE